MPTDPDELASLEYWGQCETATRWPQDWLEPLSSFSSPRCRRRPAFDAERVESVYGFVTAGAAFRFSAEDLRRWGLAGRPECDMAAFALREVAGELSGTDWSRAEAHAGLTVREWVRLLTACKARSWRMARHFNLRSENGQGYFPLWLDKLIVHGHGPDYG